MLGSNLDIMNPQWLTVIFKDRNQAYGAYELRRENPRNTNNALLIAVSAFVFALALPTIINKIEGFIPKADDKVIIRQVTLLPPPAIEKVQPAPPPVQQRQVRSQHDIVRFPPPVVRPNIETHEDPPTDKTLEKTDPGPQTMKGDPNAAVNIDDKVGPKDIEGVTESTDDKKVFIAVEVNPLFPGGEAAFGKFLRDHIRYPAVAKENNVQGRVFVQFVVERDGSLTDMKILRDPGSGLGDEAVRVLKISPHWSPGIQNGKPVRVQYTVPVSFSLAE
jgi:protein TonB